MIFCNFLDKKEFHYQFFFNFVLIILNGILYFFAYFTPKAFLLLLITRPTFNWKTFVS